MTLLGLRLKGACVGKNPDLWFPEKGTSGSEAVAICAACPVRSDCLEYGKDETFGIWGGTTPADRRRKT